MRRFPQNDVGVGEVEGTVIEEIQCKIDGVENSRSCPILRYNENTKDTSPQPQDNGQKFTTLMEYWETYDPLNCGGQMTRWTRTLYNTKLEIAAARVPTSKNCHSCVVNEN